MSNKKPTYPKPKNYQDYLKAAYKKGDIDEEMFRQPESIILRKLKPKE